MLMLRAIAMRVHPTFFDLATPLGVYADFRVLISYGGITHSGVVFCAGVGREFPPHEGVITHYQGGQ